MVSAPAGEAPPTKRARVDGEAEASAAILIEKGLAPVKSHFLVKLEQVADHPVAAAAEPKGHEVSESQAGAAPAGKAEGKDARKKLSKKERKLARAEQISSKKNICPFFARGTCDRGPECKYNHDLGTYLKNKPADLPGPCPFIHVEGKCKYGYACRYLTKHESGVGADEQEANSIHTLPLPAALHPELNVLAKDMQVGLRKKRVDFPRSREILSRMNVKGGRSRDEPSSDIGHVIHRGDDEVGRTPAREKRSLDLSNKLYLSPLTTVGNLPFRRICKGLGCDITCGEMALATNILQGQTSEWALLKRHKCEDLFGVQIAGGYADTLTRAAELISRELNVDFVDINMGCPIDLVCNKGGGASLLKQPARIETMARCLSHVMDCPLTLKMRKGYHDGQDVVHKFISDVPSWGVAALTLHGRTRDQRYTRHADWDYIHKCADLVGDKLTLIGNGDIFSWDDWEKSTSNANLSTVMIGRAALIKPWLFTEIKEARNWDISASERLDLIKLYCANGLEHWGSDQRGVETTRKYLLEWLSFTHRYIPVGLLEVLPQKMGMRPPAYFGRSDLETLLASPDVSDWVKISEMLLGPTSDNFTFTPKHKSYAYKVVDTGTESRHEVSLAGAAHASMENG